MSKKGERLSPSLSEGESMRVHDERWARSMIVFSSPSSDFPVPWEAFSGPFFPRKSPKDSIRAPWFSFRQNQWGRLWGPPSWTWSSRPASKGRRSGSRSLWNTKAPRTTASTSRWPITPPVFGSGITGRDVPPFQSFPSSSTMAPGPGPFPPVSRRWSELPDS